MKKILFASTALVLTAGYAAAEVTVGGDGRMGVVYTEGDDNEFEFNSRIRISFTASGETDTGLAFGGSIRADNAAPGTVLSTITDANGLSPGDVGFNPDISQLSVSNDSSAGGVNGLAGNVFVSGAFGKLSMGDVDSAAKAAIGQVSGVGYTGIGDLNEIIYVGTPVDESALYEYTAGGFGFYASLDQINNDNDAFSIAVNYSFGDYKVGIGYEHSDGIELLETGFGDIDHIVIGGDATFGAFVVKGRVGFGGADDVGDGETDFTQYALSVDYTAGALVVTGFVNDLNIDVDDDEIDRDVSYGLGASYDLGGGASLVGGLAHNGAADSDSDIKADFGITMSF